jgi:hypothetical protein
MTTALRLTLTTFFFALVLASPAAARHRRSPAPQLLPEGSECQRLATPEGTHPLDLGAAARFDAVRLSGAPSFTEDELWELAGGAPSLPLSKDEAVALVARLVQSGLFSAVEPRVRQAPGQEPAELEIALTEHLRVNAVRLHGLSEFRTEDVLADLLQAPEASEVERRSREVRGAKARECPAPLPPRAWLARLEAGEVRGGILWQGLRPALERVLRDLRNRGYALARLQGELTPGGDLIVDLDEGHLGRIEVRGVDPHLVREVEEELGVRRGDVFSSGELYSSLERIERRWPFLRADYGSHASPSAPALQIDERDGGLTFRSELPARTSRSWTDDDLDDEPRYPSFHRRRTPHSGWYGFEGDTLVVYLRSKRSSTSTQWTELFRHTPVTGFAPGLAGTLTLYDPGDRTHLLLDGAVNFNTRRQNLDLDGSFLEKLNGQQRVDWLAGTRLRLPALGIAELGGQIHNLTDTPDRWRISSIDSYLYSALINRADREYYRRSGYTAFITAHFFEELTLGAEYRRDRYAFLAAPPGVWALFNRDDPKYGSAPVDEGEMGSMVFRLEYRSEKVPLHKVGSMWRAPETSLIESAPWTIGLRTVDTVEVADKSLGGVFDFTKFVSDTSVTLETGRDDTLTLRLRGAGGHALPLQKQEALGGWTALRGYDFKEFRGDASLLGTLQLQGRHFGAFLDVGSVRQVGGSWIDPKASAGALFCFDRSTCAEAAWRLDSRAKALPDFRILFAVPL